MMVVEVGGGKGERVEEELMGFFTGVWVEVRVGLLGGCGKVERASEL